MKFVIPFFLVAILGTVGVHYGAQPLWRAVGLTIPATRQAPMPVVPAATIDPYVRPSVTAERPTPVQASTTPPAPARTPRLTRLQDAVEPAAPAAPAATLGSTTTSGKPEAPTAELATEPPPAVSGKPAPPPTQGSKSWGMTISRVSYYSLSGENRGQLAGGAIMDIEDTRSTSKGDMSMGRIERDGAMVGPYLVANVDLVRFNVSRSDVPADNIAVLKQYYGLKGQLEQRIAELKKQAISSNPHAVAYAEAVQKYNDFGRREKSLTAKRDAASGGERMHYVDALREMIPEEARLKSSVRAAQVNYDKWKADHPGVATTPDTAGDAQVQELRKQIATLEPKVKEIVQ